MIRYKARWLLIGLLWSALWSAQACSDPIAKNSLFPLDTFSYSTLGWYSKHLAAMEEPALFRSDDRASEVYRFLWLRTFDRPVALRLQDDGGIKSLVIKQSSGAGGYEPGDLVIDKKIEIGAQEWDAFVRLLGEANYWRLPTKKHTVFGSDGAQWILEAVRDGRYHIVDRWSPDKSHSPEEDVKFRDACLYLLELSGLEIQRVY